MTHTLQPELDLAVALCQRAAARVMAVYAGDFAVDWKSPGDPVTAADREANALLVEGLAAAFPDDAICAEEADAASAGGAAARGGRCWFVDPLDGTREFVGRNGEFAVMVGLAVDGVARLGVVHAPVWGKVFAGGPGLGAWCLDASGARTALVVHEPTEVTMAFSRSHPHPRVVGLAEKLGATRRRPCGSVGLKVALVATGDVTLYAHLGTGPKLWDGCAPEAIARGAGATVCDAAGRPLRYDTAHLGLDAGLVVAHPSLAARAVRALAP